MKVFNALVILAGLACFILGLLGNGYNFEARVINLMISTLGAVIFLGGCINHQLCRLSYKNY